MNPISVSAINAQLKALIDATFVSVAIEGEISNYTAHSIGHIYFSLKDEESSIKCVMFKGNTKSLKFELQNGQKVVVYGSVGVYQKGGYYQIVCTRIVPSGEGELALAYEQLKSKLESKGYFANKKPIPPFPKRIALLTSSSGAALQDMLRVASSRWNLIRFVVIDTLVQGVDASVNIAKNIAYADSFFGTKDAFDIIILARGGGSKEDLWAFNEEIVADAIFSAKTPIISAIGHEIDFVISDFVADLRAPTPSACMEMILPDSKEWLLRLGEIADSFDSLMSAMLSYKQQLLQDLQKFYANVSYESKIQNMTKNLQEQSALLQMAMHNLLEKKSQEIQPALFHTHFGFYLESKRLKLESLSKQLCVLNPKSKILNGYAQVSKDNKIARLADLKSGDCFELYDGEITLNAEVKRIFNLFKL